MTEEGRQARLWWVVVGVVALVGLALRIAAAQGALWTDEAWSVIYAAQAQDAAGVFLRINHDNNHHLYSLWLQAIGMDASPLLARLPAIVAGTLCVPMAALVVARGRRDWAGIVAALLFAVSPIMVNFGSEARGYSLMLLAALVTLRLATAAVKGGEKPATPWLLALAAALGMLSQMTMAAPVALVTLWVYADRRATLGPVGALRYAARLMGPALTATAAVLLFVFAAAAASPTGMRLGGYLPFDGRDFTGALDDVVRWTLGLTLLRTWLAPLLLALVALWLALRPPRWLGRRARLYAFLLLGVPLGAALAHAGNTGFPRYYLSSALGLLLLASEWIAFGLGKHGPMRAGAAALLFVLVLAGLWSDSELIGLQRGRLDGPVALMAKRSPDGARVSLDPKRLEAALTIAARRGGVLVTIVNGCAPADYVLAARPRSEPTPATISHCGVRMRALGSSITSSLTGEAWVLYGAETLQSAGGPVSGPAPGASDRRHSGRAGVAQW